MPVVIKDNREITDPFLVFQQKTKTIADIDNDTGNIYFVNDDEFEFVAPICIIWSYKFTDDIVKDTVCICVRNDFYTRYSKEVTELAEFISVQCISNVATISIQSNIPRKPEPKNFFQRLFFNIKEIIQ